MSENTEPQFADYLEQFVRNKAEIDRLTKANEELKGFIRENVESGLIPMGDLLVTKGEGDNQKTFQLKIEVNARVDDATARKYLGEERYSEFTKPTFDSAKARKALSADEYAQCQKVYPDPKITISII